jgi:hypothetical protein
MEKTKTNEYVELAARRFHFSERKIIYAFDKLGKRKSSVDITTLEADKTEAKILAEEYRQSLEDFALDRRIDIRNPNFYWHIQSMLGSLESFHIFATLAYPHLSERDLIPLQTNMRTIIGLRNSSYFQTIIENAARRKSKVDSMDPLLLATESPESYKRYMKLQATMSKSSN